MMTQKEFNFWLLFSLIALLTIAYIAFDDSNAAEEDDKAYCGMVKDFQESGGQYGWPAYKGKDVCNGI